MSGTSGTVRTVGYLLGSEFQDGQANGAITPQYVRDLIVSLRKYAGGLYNPFDYGAVANGSSNPASAHGYATLSALQAVYSFATALTNEMDWLATQAAINAATAAGGGVVLCPPGTYVCTNTNSASDGSGTLTFPASVSEGLLGSTEVSWAGAGTSTVFKWNNDLGSGKYAVLCNANRADPNYTNSSPGYFQDLCLVGPAASATLGTASANMTGIGTADRRMLRRIGVSDFWAGIGVVGGQCLWEHVYSSYCYYGVYFENPNNQTSGGTGSAAKQFGDMVVTRLVVNQPAMAAIGISHVAVISSVNFQTCFLGTTPFGVYKETNSGSPTTALATQGCTFHACQFESMGNAVVCDDTAAPANRVVLVYNTIFSQCQYGWDWYGGANFKHPTKGAYALFDINTPGNLLIQGIRNPEQMSPGTDSIFHCNAGAGWVIIGDIDTIIGNCAASAGGRSKNFATGDWQDYNNRIETIGNWSGRVGWIVGTPSVQNVLVASGSNAWTQSGGTTTESVAGVLMYNPTPAAGNVNGIIATRGLVKVNTTGTITAGGLVRTAASGAAAAASPFSETTSPVFGIAEDSPGSGVYNVLLRGLA